MHRFYSCLIAALATAILVHPVHAQNESQAVEEGGVFVDGWTGQVDPQEAENDMSVDDARLSMQDGSLYVLTGPSISYWNPENTATGNYTVMASFREPEYMNLSNHPHPYGIFIGGNDMGTENQTLLYCSAYGNGNFIVRGFGPEPFRVNGRGESNDAVNRAAGEGEPVTQEIAVSVSAESVSCAVNGTTVGTWPKSELVGEGKLKSTDGVFGVRFGHNMEGMVSGLHKM
jgi:hypothetical protein